MPGRPRKRVAISHEVAAMVAPLQDLDLEASYLTLGAQLSHVENPAHSLVTIQSVGPAFGIPAPSISVDYKKKALRFLRRYWKNILKEACAWWSKNKDKYTGTAQIASLAAAIAPALPLPWSALASVLAIIAVILLRAGIETLCENHPRRPPSGRITRPLAGVA